MTVAIYIRVSTDEQVQGFSIDVQKERLDAYCKSQGWDEPKLYIDDGYTGTNMNRPALKRLIRHIEDGKIKTVIVYKLDRLGRKQKDVLYLLEDVFEKNGTTFKSATEPFDTGTPLGKAMLGILAVFAQLERDMIIERTTSGRRQRIKQGKWPGGRVPFGYRWNEETQELEIVPEEAHIVQEIFRRYLQGQSRLAIAEWAAERVKNRTIDHNVIRDMLARHIYVGKIKNNDVIQEGNHQAIIDEEIWNAVQNEIERRKEGLTPIGDYLLTGLLACGVCGGTIVHVRRRTNVKGKEYLYELYACQKQHVRFKDRKGITCSLGYQRRVKVENFVVDKIKQLSLNPKLIKEMIENKRDNHDDDNLRTSLQKQLAAVNDGIENILDAIQSGSIKASTVSERIRKLEEEREAIQLKIDDLDDYAPNVSYKDFKLSIDQVAKAWPYMTDTDQKESVRLLVSKVILRPNADPEIVWNI